jgi:hypothetical protein
VDDVVRLFEKGLRVITRGEAGTFDDRLVVRGQKDLSPFFSAIDLVKGEVSLDVPQDLAPIGPSLGIGDEVSQRCSIMVGREHGASKNQWSLLFSIQELQLMADALEKSGKLQIIGKNRCSCGTHGLGRIPNLGTLAGTA